MSLYGERDLAPREEFDTVGRSPRDPSCDSLTTLLNCLVILSLSLWRLILVQLVSHLMWPLSIKFPWRKISQSNITYKVSSFNLLITSYKPITFQIPTPASCAALNHVSFSGAKVANNSIVYVIFMTRLATLVEFSKWHSLHHIIISYAKATSRHPPQQLLILATTQHVAMWNCSHQALWSDSNGPKHTKPRASRTSFTSPMCWLLPGPAGSITYILHVIPTHSPADPLLSLPSRRPVPSRYPEMALRCILAALGFPAHASSLHQRQRGSYIDYIVIR